MTDRHSRRRERTRGQLVDAARALFARQGVEATPINAITEQADVGFGSFYNHFESKEDIVEAVLEDAIRAQGEAIDALTGDLEDIAEVVAVAHRHFVRVANDDPNWGWLLVRLDVTHDIMKRALAPLARRDIDIGLKSGRFDVPDPDLALQASGGALIAVMRMVLDGRAGRHADRHHAAGVLRMLGVPAAEAAEVAARRMPRVTVTLEGA